MAVDMYMTMLFVDQGMGNLISLTAPNNASDVKYNALIDFGAQDIGKAGPDTAAWVAGILTNGGKKNAVLDLVVISHKDDDHWSLFPSLVGAINKLGKTLTIKKLYYGDEKKNYKTIGKPISQDVIDYLSPMVPGNKVYYVPAESSHYYTTSLNIFDTYDGVKFIPVVANVATTRRSSKDIVANTLSIVMAVLNNKIGVMLPGDATAETLAAVYELFDNGLADDVKQPFMLSVPHHGALRTLASNYKSKDPKLQIADDFALELDPWNIGASAGFNTYGHPDGQVLDLFGAYVRTRKRAHDYVAFSRSKNVWEKITTKDGIFTTYLTIGSDGKGNLADRCRVVFIIQADKTSRIGLIPVGQAGLPPT